jgi:hypothetical protein
MGWCKGYELRLLCHSKAMSYPVGFGSMEFGEWNSMESMEWIHHLVFHRIPWNQSSNIPLHCSDFPS